MYFGPLHQALKGILCKKYWRPDNNSRQEIYTSEALYDREDIYIL